MGKMHWTLRTVYSKIDQARQISISEQNIPKNQVYKIRNSSEIVKISGSNREYIYSSSVSMRRPLTTYDLLVGPLPLELGAVRAHHIGRYRNEKEAGKVPPKGIWAAVRKGASHLSGCARRKLQSHPGQRRARERSAGCVGSFPAP